MRKNYLISLLALSAMAVSASSMAKENVTVSGSTTVLPVMQKISEHLMQKILRLSSNSPEAAPATESRL